MKQLTYKQVFWEIYEYLNKKGELIDYGLDWLRIKSPEINFNFDYYLKQNSTMWNGKFINIYGVDYLVISGNSSMGATLTFVYTYTYKWLSKSISIFRILKNRLNHTYLLDFYGLAFQLRKLINLDLNEIKNFVFWQKNWEITRIDYNFNYSVKNQENIIKKIYKKYDNVKNKNIYKNETITMGLYNKKWRNNGKVQYRLTTRFWFRLYNKTQNVFDLGVASIYEQYLGLDVLRLEGVLWSDACDNIKTWTIEEIEKQAIEKIIWNNNIIKSNNNKLKRKTTKQLEKLKLDLNSRIETYVRNGWFLEDLSNLQTYINYKDDQKEIFF